MLFRGDILCPNCTDTVILIRRASTLMWGHSTSWWIICKMFFRHHSPSPDCGIYIKRICDFCKRIFLEKGMMRKKQDGGEKMKMAGGTRFVRCFRGRGAMAGCERMCFEMKKKNAQGDRCMAECR